MALIKGICKNFGECDLADSKEVQEVDKTNYVCEECGKLLYPVEGSKSKSASSSGKSPNWLLIGGIIAAVVVVLAGAGIASWFIFRSPKIAKVKLDKKQLSLILEESPKVQLTANALDKENNKMNKTDITYIWKTDNESVAIVSPNGEVTAVGEGNANIIVQIKDEDIADTCVVEVSKKPVEEPIPVLIQELKLSETENFTLKPGKTKKLECSVIPEQHDDTLTWESSDLSVATVDASGLVTAVKEGKAVISVKATNVSATVNVIVKTEEKERPYSIGWGSYEGPMSGGKPHGFGGTIIVKSTYTIDLKKASGETVTVTRGDKIVSTKMENGRLRQGEIHFADGTRKYISGL